MKRILTITLVLSLVITLSSCGSRQSQKEIIDLVEKNYESIQTACENKDTEALLAIDAITEVKVVDGYVLVFCRGSGIAPSSQDYGFYYSEENNPVVLGCNLQILCGSNELTVEGKGYQYIESGNVFYTEHIKGNIYFYSNAY